jgi:hypothetical protein
MRWQCGSVCTTNIPGGSSALRPSSAILVLSWNLCQTDFRNSSCRSQVQADSGCVVLFFPPGNPRPSVRDGRRWLALPPNFPTLRLPHLHAASGRACWIEDCEATCSRPSNLLVVDATSETGLWGSRLGAAQGDALANEITQSVVRRADNPW